MNWKKHFAEAATLVVAAVLCALISNALASRERKMALVGTYPNALKVPQEAASEPVAPLPSMTATIAPPTETTGTVLPITSTTPPTSTQPPRNPATPQPAPQPTQQPSTPATQPPQKIADIKPDLSKYQPHPDKPYIEIGFADVDALHKGGALFLDARRTNIYEQGHITGARTFSVWESDVEDKVRGLWEQRQDPKEQALPIVIYCSGGDCEDSHMLAGKLFGALFNNVYVYKDGFPDWQKRGGAIHTGAAP